MRKEERSGRRQDLRKRALHLQRVRVEAHGGRVIPVHVPDLDRQVRGFRLVQQLFELGQRFAARFVQMDVLSGPDAAQRGRNANPFLGFNRHGLQTGNGQQFFRRHHFQTLERTAVQGFLAQVRVVLHKSDNLEEIRQFAQRPDLIGVLVPGADLSDLARLPCAANHHMKPAIGRGRSAAGGRLCGV